jgi:hypothetical protein
MAVEVAQRTSISSYQLVYDGGDVTEPTAFPLGIKSGDMDLLSSIKGGTGKETKANYIEVVMTGDQAGTGTVLITGACEQGPEEAIASLAITVGTVVESGTRRWVDTMEQTAFTLSACSTLVADSGNSRVAKFGTDAIGYRYIKFYPTLTTTTNLKIYARYF